jgi:hypothetical protein
MDTPIRESGYDTRCICVIVRVSGTQDRCPHPRHGPDAPFCDACESRHEGWAYETLGIAGITTILDPVLTQNRSN